MNDSLQLSYCVALLLLSDSPHFQFGLLSLGSAPGGGNSNQWTIMLDGNIDMSIAMTVISNVAALGFMPLWLSTLGATFWSERPNIPYGRVLFTLVLLLVPAGLSSTQCYFRLGH